MARKSDIRGMRELETMFQLLNRVPQTVATKSARAGATIGLNATRKNAPEDEGDLKRALIMKREKSRTKSKAVYDVQVDPAKNDHFVKKSKIGERSYYPASQEYGFITVDGGYVPGYRYMRNSADDNRSEIERKILDVTGQEIDKVLRKGKN